jgi:hypothetical protein
MFGEDPPVHLVIPGERKQNTTAWHKTYRTLVRIYNEHGTLQIKNLLPDDHTDSKYVTAYRLYNPNKQEQWMTNARVAWIIDTFDFDLVAP